MVGLQGEMLEDFLSFQIEETSQLLLHRVSLKQLFEFQLSALVRVIAHQVLSQENAWVETSANARVNSVYNFKVNSRDNWVGETYLGS